MRLRLCPKGAPGPGAPFAFRTGLLLAILLCCLGTRVIAGECPATRIHERVQVIYVYDGDTLKLADGPRLRLIGINTPEVGHHAQATQAYAHQAQAALTDLLEKHNRILLLQYGMERTDRYGRLLAHAWLDDGTNVAAHLLQLGLATTLVVPPNTRAQACYQRQEDRARSTGLGLWSLPAYQSQASGSLPRSRRGFHISHGTVRHIRQSRRNIWITLDGPLTIRISRKDLVNFDPDFPDGLEGRAIEVRGWLKADRDGLRLNIRHPAALAIISPSGGY
jgi:endonuclease YncB( thermonuclease family)